MGFLNNNFFTARVSQEPEDNHNRHIEILDYFSVDKDRQRFESCRGVSWQNIRQQASTQKGHFLSKEVIQDYLSVHKSVLKKEDDSRRTANASASISSSRRWSLDPKTHSSSLTTVACKPPPKIHDSTSLGLGLSTGSGLHEKSHSEASKKDIEPASIASINRLINQASKVDSVNIQTQKDITSHSVQSDVQKLQHETLVTDDSHNIHDEKNIVLDASPKKFVNSPSDKLRSKHANVHSKELSEQERHAKITEDGKLHAKTEGFDSLQKPIQKLQSEYVTADDFECIIQNASDKIRSKKTDGCNTLNIDEPDHVSLMNEVSKETSLSPLNMRLLQEVAMFMTTKTALLLRDLKKANEDLATSRSRCAQLEQENKLFRRSLGNDFKEDDEDLVRNQLETLLEGKAQLAQENAYYARENQILKEMLEYHRFAMWGRWALSGENFLEASELTWDSDNEIPPLVDEEIEESQLTV